MQPKISNITPCLNQEMFLEETILSVLKHDFSNLEYIILDGVSSDNSVIKLTDADRENSEIDVWIDFAFDCGYLPVEGHKRLTAECKKVGAMLWGLRLITLQHFV
jgi:glycosyltransferase involved in cell wall biosynthesis